MKKIALLFSLITFPFALLAQGTMTPELLWSLGRVGVLGKSPDGKKILYQIATTDIKTEASSKTVYLLDINSGVSEKTSMIDGKQFIQWDANGLFTFDGKELFISKDEGKTWTMRTNQIEGADNIRISPDGRWVAFSKQVKVETVLGKEKYSDATMSTAQIYTDLNYRHWDAWNDGTANHVFVASLDNQRTPVRDLLEGEPYDSPQKPFGGTEDFIFSPDSKTIVYVCKKKVGKAYATSTNTDIYAYNIASGTTNNLSEGMMGYDVAPAFNSDGSKLAWQSMKQDGFEADKNDIVVMDMNTKRINNITASWDETVDGGFEWYDDGKTIFFTASIKGTQQLFRVMATPAMASTVKQVTKGVFNVNSIVSQLGETLVVTRTDMNHATELFSVNVKNGDMKQLSHANDEAYSKIKLSRTELRMVTTSDGKQMGTWIIYPPDFDPAKKYPTLLYCQGGPQSGLTQFYSIRWNFQLMAANGYIVVAPNRRGMPGWGVKWNADISNDWGGQPMRDYLAAIDEVSKEPYVDKSRLGCVGASYGGYSVFMLAGIHGNRFKSFIAHDGLFDMKSWYGTTEELWFANWDLGGSYWQKPQPKGYEQFNPSNFVDKWNAPILIIQGGIDFRVPIEQGLEAFQAAQLRGIKSKLLYMPNENHWVLHCHNGLVWQREFFSWLKETL